jgi:hypothetical protein
MRFLNREEETENRNAQFAHANDLAAVYGQRRIGKTRLLVEWVRRHGGVYTVADQSAADVQRRYLAEAIATRLPGFADVVYGDWRRAMIAVSRGRGSRPRGWPQRQPNGSRSSVRNQARPGSR